VLKETTTRYNFFQSLHEIKIVKRDMTRGPWQPQFLRPNFTTRYLPKFSKITMYIRDAIEVTNTHHQFT
jgi:hypothetical protein